MNKKVLHKNIGVIVNPKR